MAPPCKYLAIQVGLIADGRLP